MAKRKAPKSVEVLTHDAAARRNIPTAEHDPVMAEDDRNPVEVAYERRNRDLDPQLVWRGKDEQNWSDLVVQAPPFFIQEKSIANNADTARHLLYVACTRARNRLLVTGTDPASELLDDMVPAA